MADIQEKINEYGFHPYQAQYSENACNRFENLEGIEGKILNHLLYSESRHAQNIWKILKDNMPTALNGEDLTPEEKMSLVFISDDEGEFTDKRFFMQPFVDDAWSKQCSSVYVYVDEIHPIDYTRAKVIVTVEVVVHSRISVLKGNSSKIIPSLIQGKMEEEEGEKVFFAPRFDSETKEWSFERVTPDKDHTYLDLLHNKFYTWSVNKGYEEVQEGKGYASTQYNPNDYDKQGDIVVAKKNRATVLLKSIIAELNGLYLDGIGYLFIDPKLDPSTGAKLSLWNSRSFYGYTIKFATAMGNVSDDPNIGF